MFNIEKAQVKNVASQNYEVHHNLRVVKVRKQKKLCPNHRTRIERFECLGELAQLGERHVCTVKVRGSIPLFSTIICR